jgi:Tol biopolymer transport system component/tRNA A-37 threonylcarbamoyl transferase component Bud32
MARPRHLIPDTWPLMTDPLDRLTTALADRYTIERELGRGGMAVVYLARDRKLGREVALKVLRPDLAASLGSERFLREIEIAAKLTHPNILALYDCGEADGQLFYTMPFVEGESLRDRLDREKQLPIDDALQITKEVADALGHAHSLGIVHRDIKPENILFTTGHAVVADFGIARAVSEAGVATLTETGLAVGTPAYMSPEQATGTKEIDARSDLYSLGCVLYEMLSGDTPYTASTPQAVIAKKLSEPTPRVSVVRERVPMSVQVALDTVLAKTPADRFTTAAQFTEALHAVGVATLPGTQPQPAAPATRRWLLPGVVAAAVVVVIAVVLVRVMGSGPFTITTSHSQAVTTDPGVELQPAISPDGKEVAYIAGAPGRVIVRSTIDIGTGGGTRPAEEVGGYHYSPVWTPPDGASLRFSFCTLDLAGDCGWKEVGTRGGSVRTVDVPSDHWAWSPEGDRVAFAVGDSLFASAADNGEPELLGVHVVEPWEPHSLAWSPDGRRIAYVNGNPWWRVSPNVANASIWVLDAGGGEPVRVTDEEDLNVSPQWLPDSRHLLFVSNREGRQREVYVVEVGPTGPRGEPRKVPGPTDAHSISISADGRTLAYAKFTVKQNIRSIPIPRSGTVSIRDAVPVTTGNQLIENFSLSRDGKWIVFESDSRGKFDLYKQRLDGGDQQLVAAIPGVEYAPAWSPDGSEIAFYSGSTGPMSLDIRVVPADGGAPERLTDFPGQDTWPDWSPDGLTIAYQSLDGVPFSIWIVSRDRVGGPWSDPVPLTDFVCGPPGWAPDGASLVCLRGRQWLRVSRDGDVLSRTVVPQGIAAVWSFKFSPDGSRIYFRGTHEDGTDGLWWMPAGGGDATNVVTIDDPSLIVPHFSVGPDHLYVTVGEWESDIWVMELEW